MGIAKSSSYTVEVDSGKNPVLYNSHDPSLAIPIREGRKVARQARYAIETLKSIGEEYNINPDVLYKPFKIKTGNVFPSYNGYDIDGLDLIKPGLIGTERAIRHETSHMGHRRAIEDAINKEKHIPDVDDIKGSPSLIMKGIHFLNRKINKGCSVRYDKSEEVLGNLFKYDQSFCEDFANRHANLTTASYACYALPIIGGAVITNNAVQAISSNSDAATIAGTSLSLLITGVLMYEGATGLKSAFASKKEKGIFPNYFNNIKP